MDDLWNWWSLRNLANDPRPVIADITKVHHDVKFRLPESLNYYKAMSGMPLRSKDNIATEAGSTAMIKFKNGLEIEIQPNSLVVIEDLASQEGSLELTFLRGEIKVIGEAGKTVKVSSDTFKKKSISFKTKKVGNETKVEIAGREKAEEKKIEKNALRDLGTEDEDVAVAPPIQIDLGAIEKSVAKKDKPSNRDVTLEDKKEGRRPTMIAMKEMPTSKPEKPKIPVNKETLSDSHIASVIREKRAFLNRCYAQHLRLNPEARGRIDTSLTIEPDGSISSARVVASTIADPSLQQCVITTLQRCRFKNFRGDAIVLRYPINFE